MRHNAVKEKLRRGETALGTMVFEFRTPGTARIAAAAGAEFVIFDTEHTGWTAETTAALIASARGTDAVPLVRVPAARSWFIAQALDAGAMGVMVPMVETAGQARAVVDAVKYPPAGRRGAAFGIAHDDYLAGADTVATMDSANNETLVIVQIETREGAKNLADIATVDGVDVLWIGHFDLTNSLGIPGQFGHPEYLGVLDRCAEAARANGKSAGFMASSVDEARSYIERGFRAIAYWGDLWIYGRALHDALSALRAT